MVAGQVSDSFDDTKMCGYAIYLEKDKDAVIANQTNLTAPAAPEPLLFLPAAGYRNYGGGSVNGSGSGGYYWSSTVLDADRAWDMLFSSSTVNAGYSNYRAHGVSLRCLVE